MDVWAKSTQVWHYSASTVWRRHSSFKGTRSRTV